MTAFEIALAQAYLSKSGQDPVAALVRSVRDVARMRRLLAGRTCADGASVPSLEPHSLARLGA